MLNAEGKEMAEQKDREWTVGVLVKLKVYGQARDVEHAVNEFRRWSQVGSSLVSSVDHVWMLPDDLPEAANEILAQLTSVARNGWEGDGLDSEDD
jgi:hypothetical protein